MRIPLYPSCNNTYTRIVTHHLPEFLAAKQVWIWCSSSPSSSCSPFLTLISFSNLHNFYVLVILVPLTYSIYFNLKTMFKLIITLLPLNSCALTPYHSYFTKILISIPNLTISLTLLLFYYYN